MGLNISKVTYECDCGYNWGSCEERSFFLLVTHRGSDHHSIFHKHHADQPNAGLERMGSMSDEGLAALIKLLTQESTEEITKEDRLEMEKVGRI